MPMLLHTAFHVDIYQNLHLYQIESRDGIPTMEIETTIALSE